jgi:ABC-type Mn2+/Zn2+ transport system ATPase subunit
MSADRLGPAPADKAPLVEVSGVSLRFAGKPVLEHVDLTVDRGEIVTLIGPNG